MQWWQWHMNTYTVEEYLIVSVWVHKEAAQVRQWSRWWHLFFQQWFGKPSLCRATLLSLEKMCLFIWECERFSLEWSTNNLNGDLCHCCHFRWTVTAQFHMEMISRTWSTALTMFDHMKSFWLVFLNELSQPSWHETLSQNMCTAFGMVLNSFVSWESSIFRQMCHHILKCFLGPDRILILHLRLKTTHHTLLYGQV